FDAAVVDLDALLRVEIVPDDHLLAAADGNAANLDGGQPAQIDVGNHARFVVRRHIGNVRQRRLHVTVPGGLDVNGLLAEQEIQDREVVRGQVPQDINVG